MPLPKISVITPSYNQGQYLEETILSVIGQNYPELEFIIMDGGSTDESVNIIKKYERHLAYWESTADKGQSHAINKGMARATGDILCWLNSDDLYLPSTFASVVGQIGSFKEAAFIYGNCIQFLEGESGTWSHGTDVVAASQTNLLQACDFINQSSTFWTKKAWEAAGPLREDMHYAFDWEWFLRLQKEGVPLRPVGKTLSLYRFHKAHKSGNGGHHRRNEILAVYQQYSARYADLFAMVSNEKRNKGSITEKLVRRSLRILKQPVTQGNLLKYLKRRKYKNYHYKDLDRTLSML